MTPSNTRTASSGGLSRSDNIAIGVGVGVGVGIGLPAVIISILGVWYARKSFKLHQRKEDKKNKEK